MRIDTIMKKPPITVSEGETVVSAAKRMRDATVSFLPVLDEGGTLTGCISEREVTHGYVAGELSPSTVVASVMNRDVATCRARDDIFEAQKVMRERHVRRVVCVDDHGAPVGVLTLSGVARHEDGLRLAKTVREATQSSRRV